MDTKLTLNIDKSIVENAKAYAYKNGKSLSKLIESYLRLVTGKTKTVNDIEISQNVKSLMGILKVTEGFNYKRELSKAISEKHLR